MLVGYESFAGWLLGGLESWKSAGLMVGQAELVDAEETRREIADGAILLDVREPNGFATGRIDGAVNVPLGSLCASQDQIPRDRPILAQFEAGARAGFERPRIVEGGIGAWKDAWYAVV